MDKDLFVEIYQTYYDPVYRYLLSLTHDSGFAEDLTQETFLKAILSLPETHSNLRAWFYLVAKNIYIDYLRNHHMDVHLETEQIRDTKPPSQDEDSGDLNASDAFVIQESPEQEYLNYERSVVVDRALRQLSEPSQTILRLTYYDGYSQKEIAELLGLTPGNVRVLSLRGRKKLKAILEQHETEVGTI